MDESELRSVGALRRDFDYLCFFSNVRIRADAQEAHRALSQASEGGLTPEQIHDYSDRLQELTRRVGQYERALRAG